MNTTAMHAAATPSIEPPPGLTTPSNPESGQKSQFALFSDSWIELQGYVGAATELPINKGSFEEKYGTVDGSKTVLECIDAMKGVQAASTEFGNPRSLRAKLIKDPGILASPEPPEEIYTHTVWLGQRVHDTATRLVSGYESVLLELPSLPPREQVENLKAYLFDQTLGPIPLAQKMSAEVATLIRKLGKFEQTMNEYNSKLQAFTNSSSTMIPLQISLPSICRSRMKSWYPKFISVWNVWRRTQKNLK